MKKNAYEFKAEEIKKFGAYAKFVYENWEGDNWESIIRGEFPEDSDELALVNDIYEDIDNAIFDADVYLCDVQNDFTFVVMTTPEKAEVIRNRVKWVDTKMDKMDRAMYVR